MKKVRLILIILISAGAIFFLWQYLNGFLAKSKASTDKVNVTYTPATVTSAKGANFNFGVNLVAENSKKISGVDLQIKYGNGTSNPVDYQNFQTTPENYFDDKIIEKAENGVVHLVLVAKKADENLVSGVLINLGFKAGNSDSTSPINLVPNANQVVGPTQNQQYEVVLPTTAGSVTVGNGSAVTPSVTPPSGTPSTTPPDTGNAKINFKVRFQGITDRPSAAQTMVAKVTIKKQQVVVDEKNVTFTYDAAATNPTDKGQWYGTGNFNAAAGSGYTIYIKGPKHIQKKICDASPTEAAGAEGSYRCSAGSLTIADGEQTFNFSKIMLLAGDLPVQDGVVNSYDISLVRNNLGKTDADVLAKADINLDGRINTQDYSLIIFTLSMRTDEE